MNDINSLSDVHSSCGSPASEQLHNGRRFSEGETYMTDIEGALFIGLMLVIFVYGYLIIDLHNKVKRAKG